MENSRYVCGSYHFEEGHVSKVLEILPKVIASPKLVIGYTELAKKVGQGLVDGHDPRLWAALGEASRREEAAGRGLISACVVHINGETGPGNGFFELAKALGRNVGKDKQVFWLDELKHLRDVHKRRRAR